MHLLEVICTYLLSDAADKEAKKKRKEQKGVEVRLQSLLSVLEHYIIQLTYLNPSNIKRVSLDLSASLALLHSDTHKLEGVTASSNEGDIS